MNTNKTTSYSYPIGTKKLSSGSHMPIDFGVQGWTWRNPLNLLPLGIVALLMISIAHILLA